MIDLEILNKQYHLTLKQYNKASTDYVESLKHNNSTSLLSPQLLSRVSTLNDKLTQLGTQITSINVELEPTLQESLKDAQLSNETLKLDLEELNVEKEKIRKAMENIQGIKNRKTYGSLVTESNYYGYVIYLIITLICILGLAILNY
tara:strand:- start:3372 stop:3812 length:441 start_codon:yes stop_codon:yes gene_type:complete